MQAQLCAQMRWVEEEVEVEDDLAEEERGRGHTILVKGHKSGSASQEPMGRSGKYWVKTQSPSPVHSAFLQRFHSPAPHSPQCRQDSAKHSGRIEELERSEDTELDLREEETDDALRELLTEGVL